MYTECPNCHTYFKITPGQLKAAEGKVRCGGCRHVFNALTHLAEKSPRKQSKPVTPKKNQAPPRQNKAKPEVDFDDLPLTSNSLSINLADTGPSEESLWLDDQDLNEANLADELSPSATNKRDDINEDIKDALSDIFDDEPEINPQNNRFTEPESKFINKKKDPPLQPAASDLDLDNDFDDLLMENHQEANSPPLEAMPDNDSFLSDDALQAEDVEWETLTRPSSSRSTKETSKLDTAMSYTKASFNLSRAMWVAIIVALLIVLLGQFAYSKHKELIKNPFVHPILEQACATLDLVVDCQLPVPRDVEAIVVIDVLVEGHPNAENALLITGEIRSDATFSQPFPELVLTFSNSNKEILARRIFKPHEYLSPNASISSGMFEKIPATIMLEIVDPGETAVNYEFGFR